MVNCCVVGCKNDTKNKAGISFFRFPSRKSQKERREKWIQAVNRITRIRVKKNLSLKAWCPSPHTRICSAHFFSGEPSKNETNVDFVPTLFVGNCNAIKLTVKRVKRQKKDVQIALCSDDPIESVVGNDVERTKDVGCQVRWGLVSQQFEFTTDFHDNDVGCQATICGNPFHQAVQTKDQGTDMDVDYTNATGFHGYSNLTDPAKLSSTCGVTTAAFELLLDFVTDSKRKTYKLTKDNRLCLFLMKLKLGLTFTALAAVWNVHRTTATKIFFDTLTDLTDATKDWIFWPSSFTVQRTLPETFRTNYPTTRVIIDCFEVRTQQPPTLEARINQYSMYKSGYTVKVLLGITPDGFISFKSACYGGRRSDSQIVNDSGILSLLQYGDTVMADKGFPGIITGPGVTLVVPPMVHNGRLTHEEVERTRGIASLRIHVERAIQRVKNFRILQFVPISLMSRMDDVIHITCVVTNLSAPLIKS